MKCIILAGGFATRLWPLSENKAKPLLHLKDRPLISHIIDQLPHDIEIIVVTNAVFEKPFERWSRNYKDRSLSIFVEDSASDDFKKGALGATAFAIESLKIQEDLLLLAGDNYFGFGMSDFLEAFKGNPLLAAYDIGDLEAAKKFGVVIERDGKVIEFQEKPEQPKSTLVSTGCLLFPVKNLPDILYYAKQKKDDLGGVFEYLLEGKKERVDVFKFDQAWVDIGSFEAYLKGNQDLIGEQVIENKNVQKKGDNQFSGSVFLGENVVVEDSILENTLVMPNTRLTNCVIRHCVIDEDCDLKNLDLSYKMIRQGSKIER